VWPGSRATGLSKIASSAAITQRTNDVLERPKIEGIGDFEGDAVQQRGEVVGANLDIVFVELSNSWFS
jgi:hypothetical protein